MTHKPDFFIVGAPKSGTTALDFYLSQHPDIFMCPVKDCGFFGKDHTYDVARLEPDAYLRLFDRAGSARRIGEASVTYLCSATAAEEIKEFNPAASIIVMLRNPVDMMYSLHSEHLYSANEDITNFATALAAEPARRAGRQIPATATFHAGLCYRDMASYAVQIERYLDAFGAEKLHVILFEDFVGDTAEAYRKTLAFLGVDDSFRPQFRVKNPNKAVRSKSLRSLVLKPRGLPRLLGKALVPRSLRGRVARFLWRINARPTERPPIDPTLRTQLTEEFAPEVQRLERLLGLDLSHWRATDG